MSFIRRLPAIAFTASCLIALTAGAAPAPGEPDRAVVRGMDISYWQGPAAEIDWRLARERGSAFVYVKVSEGSYGGIATRYAGQREAAAGTGHYTGPYHFANPNAAYASGGDQARLFAGYSARWDGPSDELWEPGKRMLPPMLDLEWNPYPEDGDACYDRTPAEMVIWIRDFVDTATRAFGRAPVIYTGTEWWKLCTGDSSLFADTELSLASWTPDKAQGPGALPASWTRWTFWQHGDDDVAYTPKEDLLPGDQQYFRGTDQASLDAYANESRE
jgi:GH25 family lysozyme M1 (1,4-beta-N-acetylmuramidase)